MLDRLMNCPVWAESYDIQRDTWLDFHKRCVAAAGDSCALRPLDVSLLTLQRNIFSTLFIAASLAVGVTRDKIRFYAMVNQCLRALVTACDNLLDAEFKEVIPFDLPGDGATFRSVLSVMVADRVLADMAAEELAAGRCSLDEAKALSRRALAVLMPSGLEEHEEESRQAMEIVRPEEIIYSVHRRKTGLLFQAPLAMLSHEPGVDASRLDIALDAMMDLGLGCQALDDMEDVAYDLSRGQHNLVASLAFFGEIESEKALVASFIRDFPASNVYEEALTVAVGLESAHERCRVQAHRFFDRARRHLMSFVPGFGEEEAATLTGAIAAMIQMGGAAQRAQRPFQESAK